MTQEKLIEIDAEFRRFAAAFFEARGVLPGQAALLLANAAGLALLVADDPGMLEIHLDGLARVIRHQAEGRAAGLPILQ